MCLLRLMLCSSTVSYLRLDNLLSWRTWLCTIRLLTDVNLPLRGAPLLDLFFAQSLRETEHFVPPSCFHFHSPPWTYTPPDACAGKMFELTDSLGQKLFETISISLVCGVWTPAIIGACPRILTGSCRAQMSA